ncbi:hypothetical protein ACFX2I_027893 [Malus domestica]
MSSDTKQLKSAAQCQARQSSPALRPSHGSKKHGLRSTLSRKTSLLRTTLHAQLLRRRSLLPSFPGEGSSENLSGRDEI